jgi:sucrose-6-phosphate hydrolase SacC (GH32 family)
MSNWLKHFSIILVIAFGALLPASAQDLPIGHFTNGDYGDWQATGDAFKFGPAGDDWLPKLEIENAADNLVISSEKTATGQDDQPQGTLTSPQFKIARKYISFRIGGGDYERDTCINLVVDGKIVRSATGWQSDRLVPTSWDVSAWQGRSACVQIVDAASEDWGHINVAGIVQTDKPERMPVETGPLYHEALRPQFHFTARQWTMARLNPGMRQEGWINDLNGLIYYDGEYHLFAQRWAKCWLHAVSRDLIHWTELPPAFWEEESGSGVQSGTCVVDYKNTSGLASDPAHPAMVAFYPRWNNRDQCIAYSLDHGRTWKFYDKNPILVHPERDPQVFWYAPSNHWVMMLYGNNQYHILTSTNLLSWQDEHHPIKNSFECPDFFELPVDGDRSQMKWVLIQGNGNYSVGTFDGVEFTEAGGRHPCDVGPNFYATQSWHNTDTGDGRRIQIAWMRGSNFPDMPFNQQISFPCELTLHDTTNGLRIFRRPIPEISLLHDRQDVWTNRTLSASQTLPLEPAGQLFQLKAEVEISEGARLVFKLRGASVVLTQTTLASGSKPAAVGGQIHTVEMLIDRASIEAFANDGEISSTRFFLPSENGLSVKAEAGTVRIKSLTVYPLKSAWPENP